MSDLSRLNYMAIRVGHTHTAIHGVMSNKKSTFVVVTENHARSLKNQYPEINVKSLNGLFLQGSRNPIVFDHSVVNKMAFKIGELQKSVEEKDKQIAILEAALRGLIHPVYNTSVRELAQAALKEAGLSNDKGGV